MLASEKVFACSICAAAPVNQKLQGCFVHAPKPNVILEYSFEMCPVRYRHPLGLRLLRLHNDGFMQASFNEKHAAPNKRMAAIQFIDYLKQLRKAHDY